MYDKYYFYFPRQRIMILWEHYIEPPFIKQVNLAVQSQTRRKLNVNLATSELRPIVLCSKL